MFDSKSCADGREGVELAPEVGPETGVGGVGHGTGQAGGRNGLSA
jgi:hypothetical protein